MYILYIYYTQFSDTPIYLDVPNAIVFCLIGYSVRMWESTANHILLVPPWITNPSTAYIYSQIVLVMQTISNQNMVEFTYIYIYIYMYVCLCIYIYMYVYIYIYIVSISTHNIYI